MHGAPLTGLTGLVDTTSLLRTADDTREKSSSMLDFFTDFSPEKNFRLFSSYASFEVFSFNNNYNNNNNNFDLTEHKLTISNS